MSRGSDGSSPLSPHACSFSAWSVAAWFHLGFLLPNKRISTVACRPALFAKKKGERLREGKCLVWGSEALPLLRTPSVLETVLTVPTVPSKVPRCPVTLSP